MKFNFRLQTVFDLRQHLESEQKDELARERQRLIELEAEQRGLHESFSAWSGQYMESARTGMCSQDAVIIINYLDEIDKNIVSCGRQIEQQNAVVERERLLLIERMKDRRTMETLYDKQHERFKYEQSKQEEKEVDELISARR